MTAVTHLPSGVETTPVPASNPVRRTSGRPLAVVLVVLALIAGVGAADLSSADASVRLGSGAFGSYGLDCSGFRSARLSVQGGANGIPVNGFKYWLYNVDTRRYEVSGAWVALGSGWSSTSLTLTRTPGRYNVYVEYWSFSGGRWYTGGEWAWATNLTQPVNSQTCRVL